MKADVVVCERDADAYRAAVQSRCDAKLSVLMAWEAWHHFHEARVKRPFTLEEQQRGQGLRNAALECEGVYERALAREREAGDRVLKVVLHG